MINKKLIMKIINISLIIFGSFILFQIIRKLLGGSWTIEAIVLSLQILILGIIFGMKSDIAEIKSDLKNLKNQFKSLAGDFKIHVKKEID